MWCIPPKANAEFVWKMEDVLQVYKRPYDPLRPVVCMDETSKQLIRETRLPVEAAPGQPRRVDYEYERKGVADLFMFFEPLRGWRRVWITPQRRKVEWAWCVKQLLDEHYPEAERLVLVCDNLNTHTGGALYEAFPAAEARRLVSPSSQIRPRKTRFWFGFCVRGAKPRAACHFRLGMRPRSTIRWLCDPAPRPR